MLVRRAALLGAVVCALAACGSDGPVAPLATTDPVQQIALTVRAESLLVGDTVTLGARALDSSGVRVPGAVVTWRSLDEGVATVDASGHVQTHATGSARVVVHALNVEDTVTLTILPPIDFAGIDVGGRMACGVATSGDAYCWGSGESGQLGAGSALVSDVQRGPVLVAGGHHFAQVTVGETHACALTADGVAYCWGSGYFGELGTGTVTALSPAPVVGGHHFTMLSAGLSVTCGVTDAAEVYCWGLRATGSFDAAPALLPGVSLVTVSVGDRHTCGVDAQGAAWCWGSNILGALGVDGTDSSAVPVRVQGGHTFATVATSSENVFSCGIAADAVAWCWGSNYGSTLGVADPNVGYSATPLQVEGGVRWTTLSLGSSFACGIDTAATVQCWGTGYGGVFGDGTEASRAEPGPVALPGPATQVASGALSTCALVGTRVYCWGGGALGDGSASQYSTRPVAVSFARPLGG